MGITGKKYFSVVVSWTVIAFLVGGLCANAQNLENGHEYVDLGLPSGLKWATMNVGADTPEAYGDGFAWGETEPKETYTWDTYSFMDDDGYLTKYNSSDIYGVVDNKITLDPEDDAAIQNWGGVWRMPTNEEWQELVDNCDWTWTILNGVNGYEVKSKANGNSIFLPAAGNFGEDTHDNVNGYYWANLIADGFGTAWMIAFSCSKIVNGVGDFCCGVLVRPVCEVSSPITALQPTESVDIYAENGRIVCKQDFRIFDLLGRDVTRMNGQLNGVYVVKCGEKTQKIVVR